MKRLTLLGFLAYALIVAIPVVHAAAYYVDPAGADTNNGSSPSQPLRWIQTAINKSKPGDTIYIMPGTHKVKPGDRNITFAGKKGKDGEPITLTTSGPGVIVDLSDAEHGWGGFRICDGAEWIVVDGGGDPNPFEESTYRLTLMNAAYEGASGDGRSGIVCRPVTIQNASHVIVRNLFGKRSMGGMGIFGQQTRNVLVERCRLQPGEHAHDGGASHGIYVGGAADDVLIKHTFIRWGGDGRLGVQNNHGGDKNVVLEECFITECQGAIKAFNGGGIKVKNCWFWNIDESPGLQGNYTVDGLIRTPPPPDVIAKLGSDKPLALPSQTTPPATASVAKADTAKSAEPPAKKAEPASAKPTASAIDLSSNVAPLLQALQSPAAKKGIRFKMRIFGRTEEVGFAGADAQGIKVLIRGNTMPLRWKDIENEDLARVAFAALPDDQEALFHAGRIAGALKSEVLYEGVLGRLMEVSASRGMSLNDVIEGR